MKNISNVMHTVESGDFGHVFTNPSYCEDRKVLLSSSLAFKQGFINGVTFRAGHLGHGCSRGVSVNNIQKEVSWVVVGLTGET